MGNIASYQEGYTDGFADAKKKYERPQGEWKLDDTEQFCYCDQCEDTYYPRPLDPSWNYCPHCGADMKQEIREVADKLFGKIMSGDFIGHCPTPRKEDE